VGSMQGQGVGGSNATCVELGPIQGGLTFASRQADEAGYQPFVKGNSVEFWLKDMNGSSTIPDLQVWPAFIQPLAIIFMLRVASPFSVVFQI